MSTPPTAAVDHSTLPDALAFARCSGAHRLLTGPARPWARRCPPRGSRTGWRIAGFTSAMRVASSWGATDTRVTYPVRPERSPSRGRCPGSPPVVLHIDQARSQVSQGVRRCRIPSRIAAGSALASLGVFRESGRAWGLYVFLPVLWRFRSDVPPPAQAADPSASWPERSTPRSTRPRSRGRDAQSRHGPLPETHPGHEGGGVASAAPTPRHFRQRWAKVA
jgi:hypothetical protein